MLSRAPFGGTWTAIAVALPNAITQKASGRLGLSSMSLIGLFLRTYSGRRRHKGWPNTSPSTFVMPTRSWDHAQPLFAFYELSKQFAHLAVRSHQGLPLKRRGT